MASENYVKFLRGTPEAFAALATKESDTIYFIFNEDENYGKLYIGNRLVSDQTSSDSIVDTLAELTDVDVSVKSNNQVLAWDAVNSVWKPMSIPVAMVMTGATLDAAGTEGLVPTPAAGDNTKFLRGDGTWVELPTLAGLTYKKVNNVDDIDVSADDAGLYVYLVPNTSGTFTEYLVIDGALEVIGSTEVSLDGYATTAQLSSVANRVQTIEDSLNNYVQQAVYEAKIADVEARLAKTEASTTWGSLA